MFLWKMRYFSDGTKWPSIPNEQNEARYNIITWRVVNLGVPIYILLLWVGICLLRKTINK